MGFIPVLVHQFNYQTHLSEFDWYSDSAEMQIDFFLGYKAIGIILLGGIMLLTLFYAYMHKKKLSFENAFYFLFAYAGLAVMSALFSPYRAHAFRFSLGVFQPIWVVLAYVVFCYYTYHYVQSEDQIKKVLLFSGIGIMIVTVIGLLQYFEHDPFQSSLGKMLTISPSDWERMDDMVFTFSPCTVYTTLYNVDYLSFYFGMLIPIILVFVLIANAWWKRVIYVIVFSMFSICLYGSGTDSGILALGLTLITAVYILLSRNKYAFGVGIGLGVIALIAGIFVLTSTALGSRICDRVFGSGHFSDSFAITDIKTNADTIEITVHGKEIFIEVTGEDAIDFSQIVARDADGNVLTYTLQSINDSLWYVLDDTSYGNCMILPGMFDDNTYGIRVTLAGLSFDFAKISGEMYYFNQAGKLVKFPSVDVTPIFSDTFFGRGWIWNRTIPLLKKYLFLGIGANNFIIAYPQDEYLFKLQGFGNNTFDVKAHNWLLNEWVENGLPAMLCLIVFYLWYFINSVRIYRRADFRDKTVLLGFGLFLSTVTYMYVSIANDTTVNTAPVFWIVLGLGLAANRIIKNKEIEG